MDHSITVSLSLVDFFVSLTRAVLFARCRNALHTQTHNGTWREIDCFVSFRFILVHAHNSPFNTYTPWRRHAFLDLRFDLYIRRHTHTGHIQLAMVVKLKLKNINGFHKTNGFSPKRIAHSSKWTANVAHDTNKVDRDVNAQMFISKRAHSVIAYEFKGIERTNEERSCPMLAERYICECFASVLAGRRCERDDKRREREK